MKPIASRIVAAAALLLAPAATGEFKAWLDFGPDLPGESTDPGHQNWADALSFDVGHDADGTTLTCRRRIDKASPLLMQACCDPQALGEVKLDLARVEAGITTEFWQVVFQGVGLVGYSPGSSTEDPLPSEEVSFRWTSLVSTYTVFPPGQPPYEITTIVSADGDGDGLPDAYEEQVGLDPAVSNIGIDTDLDGLDDTDEYRLGTNPTDPTSFFRVVARLSGPDTMELTWPSVAGQSYSLDFSPDLAAPFAEMEAVTATSEETTHTVTRVPPAGFFRVRKDLP